MSGQSRFFMILTEIFEIGKRRIIIGRNFDMKISY
jgi:hypothetical protein